MEENLIRFVEHETLYFLPYFTTNPIENSTSSVLGLAQTQTYGNFQKCIFLCMIYHFSTLQQKNPTKSVKCFKRKSPQQCCQLIHIKARHVWKQRQFKVQGELLFLLKWRHFFMKVKPLWKPKIWLPTLILIENPWRWIALLFLLFCQKKAP